MAIRPPSLDDRSYADLVSELVARIPAHTPEWTNPVPGDPGRTLIELFAWLADTMLYRANLIPERQRLAFLRLLGAPMRPATAARGVITLTIDDATVTDAITLRALAPVSGPVPFETTSEITVLPVTGELYCKRPLTPDEETELAPVIDGLHDVYQLAAAPKPYVTTPVFAGGVADAAGFDMISGTVDKALWLAMLAPSAVLRSAVQQTLRGAGTGTRRLLNVGVMPSIHLPALFEDVGPRTRVPHVWEISTLDHDEPVYLQLDVIEDSTLGLTQRGVVRLGIPGGAIGAPTNDVREKLAAGVGDRPPRIDDAKTAERLVAWVRVRPTQPLNALALSWVGINAVEIDQRQTIANRVVGESDGTAEQELSLPATSVEPQTFELQVEEPGNGYVSWSAIEDIALAGPDDRVFVLDSEAGTVRFGDNVRGRIPPAGRRVRVTTLRGGGGERGNVAPGSLTAIHPVLVGSAAAPPKLIVQQDLWTDGGSNAETLAAAEQRIPALFRHRDRAVTEEDYRRLAADTPRVRMGRVEVLPQFKPQQRRSGVPGVVTVMVLPHQNGVTPPAPRADRPFLETVYRYLDARRVLGTELYVVGTAYQPLGAGVAVSIRDGFGRETVLQAVRDALRAFLWPLAPGGVDGTGWALGRAVRDRELEVAVARVPGVSAVNGITMFRRVDDRWQLIPASAASPALLPLERWELPELLTVVVVDDGSAAPETLAGAPNPFAADAANGIAVPVVPEVC